MTEGVCVWWFLLRAALLLLGARDGTSRDKGRHLLFVDDQEIRYMDPRLQRRMHSPHKGPRVLWPTSPWEAFGIDGYNHVVAGNASRPHRLYYDCMEGTNLSTLAERVCLAESVDGIHWHKPILHVFNRSGSTANNILVEDSGVSVFFDPSATTPDAAWIMICSAAAYKSPDGIRFSKLPFKQTSSDDTKPTAHYDPQLGKYVVFVRRDCCPDGPKCADGDSLCPGRNHYHETRGGQGTGAADRYIGRCVTSNISDWQQNVPPSPPIGPGGAYGPDLGCEVVFGPDAFDPPFVDVYTNAWTPYPSIDRPLLHLFFPSFYHHFAVDAAPTYYPPVAGNDGILDIRLVVSRDGVNLNYTSATNGREPFVPLGENLCGGAAHAPSVKDGWCNPFIKTDNANTAMPDASTLYMASGYLHSQDGREILLYYSGATHTHGGIATPDAAKTWGNNTGVSVLRIRVDGFVSIEGPYLFRGPDGPTSLSQLPSFTTVALAVPTNCPAPQNSTVNLTNGHGDTVSWYHGPLWKLTGGVQLLVNMQTSVAGFVAIELQGENGLALPGYSLDDADNLKGSALNAVASWRNGSLASLSLLAGTNVSLRVVLPSAKLFSLKLACAEN